MIRFTGDVLGGPDFAPDVTRVEDLQIRGAPAVCGANQRIRGIYDVALLEKVFRTYETVDEGVSAVTAV